MKNEYKREPLATEDSLTGHKPAGQVNCPGRAKFELPAEAWAELRIPQIRDEADINARQRVEAFGRIIGGICAHR